MKNIKALLVAETNSAQLFDMSFHQDQTIELLTLAIKKLEQTATILQKLETEIEEIKSKLENQSTSDNNLIDKYEAAKIIGCHWRTLDKYRKEEWREGIHYFPQSKGYRYNKFLIQDWLINRQDHVAQQKTIELWVSQQPCNQPRLKKTKRAS